MKSHYLWPRLLLFLAALMWSGGFIAVQDALNHGWGVNHILGFRGLLSGTFLLVLRFKSHWWRKTYLLRSGVILGILLFIGFATQTIGQELSTPSNTAFLTSFYILLVPLLSHLIKKTKIAIDSYAAILLAMAGIAILTGSAEFSLNVGDLLILGGAVSFAMQIVLLEEIALQHDPIALTGIQLMTMGILGAFLIPFSAPSAPTGGYLGLLYLALFSSCLAFLIQASCQRTVPPSTTSLLLGTESVLASAFSVLFGYETLHQRMLLGGLLFVAAIVIGEVHPIHRYGKPWCRKLIKESMIDKI